MVKYSRDQSTDAPRRRICSRMAPPYCFFHCQTRSMKASRPSRAALALGGQLPLHHHLRGDAGVIRARQPQCHGDACHRVIMSISVWFSIWPMCRRPVTLGGGSSRVKMGAEAAAPV